MSVSGQYTVDVDDVERRIFADAEYTFEASDLTQGGQYDAVFVDFTFAEGVILNGELGYRLQAPGIFLIACCYEGAPSGLLVAEFTNAVTAPFPLQISLLTTSTFRRSIYLATCQAMNP